MRNIIACIIIFCTTFACSQNNEENRFTCKTKIEDLLKIKIPNSFECVNENSDFSIRDYSEQCKLKLTKNDYLSIFNQLKIKTLKQAKDSNFYFINFIGLKNEKISIIFNQQENTIQYTLMSK